MMPLPVTHTLPSLLLRSCPLLHAGNACINVPVCLAHHPFPPSLPSLPSLPQSDVPMKQLIKHLDPGNRVILQDLDETHLFVDANAGRPWNFRSFPSLVALLPSTSPPSRANPCSPPFLTPITMQWAQSKGKSRLLWTSTCTPPRPKKRPEASDRASK